MAGTYNIIIEKGSTFTRLMTWKDSADNPINLTGYSATFIAKQKRGDTIELISLTSEDGGGITLGGSAGTITIEISDEEAALLSWNGEAVYELELTPLNGKKKRLLEGTITLSEEV